MFLIDKFSHLTEMISAQGIAALQEGCGKGSVEIISDLLEAGVPFDRDVLQIASEKRNERHVEAVKYLLLHDKNLSHVNTNNVSHHTMTMMSALRIAVEGNHIKAVELLLNQATSGSAAIDERDSDGLTLLHFAAIQGYDELLAKFGRLDQIDRYGRTALHVAASNGHVSIILLLLKSNAPIDHKDRIKIAMEALRYIMLILLGMCTLPRYSYVKEQRLLVLHMNTVRSYCNGASSLEEAVLVELLLKADASVDENDGGAAPLQLAKALIIAGTKPHELERSLTETFPSFWENLLEAEICEGFLNNPLSPKMQQRFSNLMNCSRSAIKVFNLMMKPGQQRHTTKLADFFEYVLKHKPMKVFSTIFRLTASNEKGIFGLAQVNNVMGEVFRTCWMTGATTNNDILDTLNYPRAFVVCC